MPSCAAQMKSPQAVPEKVDQEEQALKAGMGVVRRKASRKPDKEDPYREAAGGSSVDTGQVQKDLA